MSRRLLAIGLDLPAEELAARLGLMPGRSARREIAAETLERLSKRAGEERRAWLYWGRVLVLAGLEDAEEREFLLGLHPEGAPGLMSPYFEQVTLEAPAEELPAVDAVAQSLYLQWADKQVTALLDGADVLLEALRRGRPRYRSQKLRALVARTLRMEHVLASLGSPGRAAALNERPVGQRWAERYDLASRQEAVASKLAALNGIIRAYREIGDTAAEHRLLRFEVVLLAAFPLFALGTMAHWTPLIDGLRQLLALLGLG